VSQAGAPPGLSREDAARRLARDGPNQVEPPRPTPLAVRILRQFGDPLVLLLLAAFAVTLVVADYPDASVIALVVVVNTAIGVTQEVRADRAIAALTVPRHPPPRWYARARTSRSAAEVVAVTSSGWRPETSSRPICA
jgi:Ca2+-transporting ATPase